MRILLSAYACEPGRGSEPGVGWGWANELARLGHEVWVLTREKNRAAIERHFHVHTLPPKLHFCYYDLPAWASWWKKGRRGVHLYYLLWQAGAYGVAKAIHRKENFQLVHHVTFVSVRQPSFMGKLGIPFVFGPVAGGECTPWKLRSGFGFKGRVEELLRDCANYLVRFDPMMLATFAQADWIYLANKETRQLLPRRYWGKTTIALAIASDAVTNAAARPFKGTSSGLRILFVGRFVNFKGVHLAIAAFAETLQRHPDLRLTIVGQGPRQQKLADLAAGLCIQESIDWIDWVDQAQLRDIYRQHDIFLFPSLRDSGGIVVLEAMSHGLPVVCLDLAGPGEISRGGGAIAVQVKDRDEQQVIRLIAEAVSDIAGNPLLRSDLAAAALRSAAAFNWPSVVQGAISKYPVPSRHAPACSPQENSRT